MMPSIWFISSFARNTTKNPFFTQCHLILHCMFWKCSHNLVLGYLFFFSWSYADYPVEYLAWLHSVINMLVSSWWYTSDTHLWLSWSPHFSLRKKYDLSRIKWQHRNHGLVSFLKEWQVFIYMFFWLVLVKLSFYKPNHWVHLNNKQITTTKNKSVISRRKLE